MTVIPKFDRIFSTHGIPEKLISDNEPPFQNEEWARYMKSWGIKHVANVKDNESEDSESEEEFNELNNEQNNQEEQYQFRYPVRVKMMSNFYETVVPH